jgi:hypothetical protein
MHTGGGLKLFVKTRWTTAYDCVSSVLRLESAIKSVNFLIKLLYLNIYN